MWRGKKPDQATVGALRVDARLDQLASRVQAGDIAILDVIDLDAATAQVLLNRGVAAVINAAPSTSGRYPNLGPTVLINAGIPLLDSVGAAVLSAVREGRSARLEGTVLWVDDEQVASGTRQDADSVAAAVALSRAGVPAQLSDLAAQAAGFVVEEAGLLDGSGLPELDIELAGRAVLVVGPSYGARQDLAALKRWRRRNRPVLVGVDGGADVIVAAGLRADLVVGDPATMSEAALRAAGEVVACAGEAGTTRLHELAVPAVSVATRAASEDVALLLAFHAGAGPIITAGIPRTLEELLDRGREAAASSLVTRFATGLRLVHAESLTLVTPRRSWGLSALCLLLTAGLGAAFGLGGEQIIGNVQDYLR